MADWVPRFGNLEDIVRVKNFEIGLKMDEKIKIENDILKYISDGDKLGLETPKDDPYLAKLESKIPAIDLECSRICAEIAWLESEMSYTP